MKIFSSFDTELKNHTIRQYTERYGEDNIVVITRSRLYLMKKVWWHLILWVMSYLVSAILIYLLVDFSGLISYGLRVGIPFFLAFLIIGGENYIDYSMNYAIFTPYEALLVEQIGIFKRDIKSLDSRKIKSISVKKSNFWYSMFDDGVIKILNEGTSTTQDGQGEIIFKYVHKPEEVKDNILRIINQHHN